MRKNRVSSLSLGDGVDFKDMSRYANRDLVSHARGCNLSQGFLNKWVISNLGSKVSSMPEVSKLMKG